MDLAVLIPVASVSGALWLLVKSLLVFVVIVVADRLLAHEMEFKHALAVSVAAFFAIPFLLSAVYLFLDFGFQLNLILFYGLPLLVWIILAEAFLGGADHKTKLELAFIAWVSYLVIDFAGASTGIPQAISQFVPF